MFHYLRGHVAVLDATFVVLDVAGVGYTAHATATTLGSLAVGQETQLFMHLHIRENAWDIFGFSTKDERTAFLKLIDVNGVGPKAALAILSVMNPTQLAQAVAMADPVPVTQASGVGKKLAERIVRELKGKLDTANIAILPTSAQAPEQGTAHDVMSALINLGWKEADARMVLKEIEVTTFDATLKAALSFKRHA